MNLHTLSIYYYVLQRYYFTSFFHLAAATHGTVALGWRKRTGNDMEENGLVGGGGGGSGGALFSLSFLLFPRITLFFLQSLLLT